MASDEISITASSSGAPCELELVWARLSGPSEEAFGAHARPRPPSISASPPPPPPPSDKAGAADYSS